MKIGDGAWPYLTGESFDNGLRVPFDWEPDDRRLRGRFDWLEELCRGRAIVHAGCVDHSVQRLESKRRRGKWLHERLSRCASRCYGVDIEGEGIEYLRDRLGYRDVERLDLLEERSETILSHHWDAMLLGEILEHTDNPVDFLARLNEQYGECTDAFIITAPNAFARENFRGARRAAETINSDHRYWFTPFTLAKVVVQAKLRPQRLILCRNGVVKRRSLLKNAYLARHPLLRNNLIMIATPERR